MKIIPKKSKLEETKCPVTYCLSMIGGKWKPIIFFCILNKIDRFGLMYRSIEGITKQMLTKQLREMEADQLIKRTIYAEIPPRTDYALTEKGRSIIPIIEQMKIWGNNNRT